MSVRRRRRAGIALVALLAVLLAGCGVVSSLLDTETALRSAGYSSVSVTIGTTDTTDDTVKVSVSVAAVPSTTTEDQVTSIVWSKFRERFGFLALTVHGSGRTERRSYSFSELVAALGARNPAYDRSTISGSAEHLGLIVIGVGFAVLVIVVAVVLFFVVRRRRRRPVGGPPWPGAGWPPPSGPGVPGDRWGPPPAEPGGDGGWGRPAG